MRTRFVIVASLFFDRGQQTQLLFFAGYSGLLIFNQTADSYFELAVGVRHLHKNWEDNCLRKTLIIFTD